MMQIRNCLQDGQLRVFLAALPAVAAAHGARVARLTALREATIFEVLGGSTGDGSGAGGKHTHLQGTLHCIMWPGGHHAQANGLHRRSSGAVVAGDRPEPEAWGGGGGGGGGVGFREWAVVSLPAEPTLLALGPRHLAMAAGQEASPEAGL